jgi:glycine/D-amino acid oxidase-like deaminating enzyme/nitrite reductase/ring-hydroxylating ferredoxin subunit
VGILDERNPSLWIGTSGASDFAPLKRAPEVDAVVIGGGITGLTAAYLLKREGLKVALLEAGRVASGVTGYTTAKVTALHGLIYQDLVGRHGKERAAAYADANSTAVRRIREIVEAEGIDCDLESDDAYTYAETSDGADSIDEEAEACREAGLEVDLVEATDLPFSIRKAVRLRNQLRFHPRKYCLGLAAAIDGGGSHVYEHTRVKEVEELQRVVHVTPEEGPMLSVKYVVTATQIPFMGDGNFFARTYPMRAYAIAVGLSDEAPAGMYISAEQPTRSLRAYGTKARPGIIVGGESHKVGQDPDPEEHYEALEAWARERLPGFRDVEYRWSAQDYVSMDGVPFVGRLTDKHERTFVATAYRKWGMTNGTAAAMILTDAISGRDNPWAETFDSTRKRPLQAAKDFVRENVNVARHLLGDKLLSQETALAQIEPGQGAFIDVDGETVAVYVDDDGRPHAVGADCTHMGCRLSFNGAERTWDCPCHGSRFDPDGRVIQGPANEDLEKKDIFEESRRG